MLTRITRYTPHWRGRRVLCFAGPTKSLVRTLPSENHLSSYYSIDPSTADAAGMLLPSWLVTQSM
ncbi:hypothetical protein BX600DRAFT_450352, partial [Xylariales sp. PMI_506]